MSAISAESMMRSAACHLHSMKWVNVFSHEEQAQKVSMWTYWCFQSTLLAKPWTFASGLSGHHSDGICCDYIICFSSRNSSRVLWEGLTLLEGTQ